MTKGPKKNAPELSETARLLRDRLANKHQAADKGKASGATASHTGKHFKNNSPSSTARKGRKGYRPG